MKKVLLATTMLAGTAGFASAEVSVSGYAEIGIWSNFATGDVAFHQDVEVTFAMSGTTDGGLEFGAQIDLDEGNVVTDDDSGTTVWVSGAFGRLTMGDTDGAVDWALQDAGALTSLTDDHTTHVAYFGATGVFGDGDGLDGKGDGQIVRYENTFGGFSFAISAEQVDNGAGALLTTSGAGLDDIFGIGLRYTADLGGTALNLGLAYQTGGGQVLTGAPVDLDNTDVVGVSVGAEFAGGFSGMIGYMDFDYDDAANTDFSHTGIGLTYANGPISVNVNYGVIDPAAGPDTDSWGLAANYDLGGGAVVMFGYGSDLDAATAGDQDQWSLGLGLSF